MKHLPVNWREGQFLIPQHFQAADQYWAELTGTSQQWDHPYNYGLHDCRHGFEGTRFRVDVIHARMRDGTLVSRDENSAPLVIDLENVPLDEPQRIYLCVPQLNPGDCNVRSEDPDQGANGRPVRYISRERERVDENESDGVERPIEFRDLNAILKCEPEDRAGYIELPIARVRRPTLSEEGPQLDDTYFPPVLGINAWIQLGNVVRGVHDLLIQKLKKQADDLRDVRIRDHILEVSQSGRIALLDRLNEVSTVLGLMVPSTRGIHPYLAYSELFRIVGKLSIFTHDKQAPNIVSYQGPEKKSTEVWRYDHDHLGPIFRDVTDLIRRILESIEFEGYLEKSFVWKDDVMLAELTPAWFDSRVDWYIGVDRGERVSDDECRRMLSRDNNFLCKFGSLDRDIYALNAVGLDVRDEQNPNPLLPPAQYWSFWRVPTDPNTDPNFKAVFNSQKLAFYMRDYKNNSFQTSEYSGTSRFPVVVSATDQSVVEFKISLFGLRR